MRWKWWRLIMAAHNCDGWSIDFDFRSIQFGKCSYPKWVEVKLVFRFFRTEPMAFVIHKHKGWTAHYSSSCRLFLWSAFENENEKRFCEWETLLANHFLEAVIKCDYISFHFIKLYCNWNHPFYRIEDSDIDECTLLHGLCVLFLCLCNSFRSVNRLLVVSLWNITAFIIAHTRQHFCFQLLAPLKSTRSLSYTCE